MSYSVLAKVSKEKLKIIPDSSSSLLAENPPDERSFLIDVTNNSGRFASFQVELLAEGTESTLKWYQVEPEICAKKPHGDRTQFKVLLTRAPIPAYETEIKITAKILSVESEKLSTAQTLLLKIGKPQRPLKVELPFKELQVYPGDCLEIPVVVSNLSSKFAEIVLNLTGLEPNWLNGDTQKTVRLGAGDFTKVAFACTPPRPLYPTNQIYNFSIDANHRESDSSDSDSGRLEVMPFGIVKVTCPQPTQTIPSHPLWFTRRRSPIAQFPLLSHNQTNQAQQIKVDCKTKRGSIQWQIEDAIAVEPDDQKTELLLVEHPIPWFGWKRRELLEVEASLSNPVSRKPSDAVRVSPSTQVLELLIRPRIPVFVQIGALVLAALGSIALYNSIPAARHSAPVTSVRILLKDKSEPLVISASNDKTVRRWKLNKAPLQHLRFRSDLPLSPDGEIAGDTIAGKAIRVIQSFPSQDGKIAVGKENGEIELWTTSPPKLEKRLFQAADRVFDLAFTPDAKTLFSGHGSGTVRVWDLERQETIKPLSGKAAISALAVVSPKGNNPFILIGGKYNQFSLWKWQQNKREEINYFGLEFDRDREPHNIENNYINSIAVAKGDYRYAVTSDNAGYITSWSLSGPQPRLLDRWQAGGEKHQSVRSVAISANSCYIASAGNDGRLMLYVLDAERKRSKDIEIENFNASIRTVDIQQDGDRVLVASDAPKNEVKLYRVEVNNNDCK